MLRYRRGRNHFTFDLRSGRKLLMFEPYAQTARFNLPEKEWELPLIVFTYQSEAFEKLKRLFCHKGKFDLPQIILNRPVMSSFKAYMLMESMRFPTVELAKSFGMDFVIEKRIDEVHVRVISEALVRIVRMDLFAEAFLRSDLGTCRLHLREESSAYYLPDYKSSACISTEAKIICPQKS